MQRRLGWGCPALPVLSQDLCGQELNSLQGLGEQKASTACPLLATADQAVGSHLVLLETGVTSPQTASVGTAAKSPGP